MTPDVAPPPLRTLSIIALLLWIALPAAPQASQCRPPAECVPLLNCHTALQRPRGTSPNRPPVCGFSGGGKATVPDVCCPPEATSPRRSTCNVRASIPSLRTLDCEQIAKDFADNPITGTGPGTVARRMCRKHQEDLCALPPRQDYPPCPARGARADILEFPHMALLGYGERDELEYACGGSLVSPDYILTAAHCVSWSGKPVRWALLGATNRTSMAPKINDTHQLIEIAEAIVHPAYLKGKKYHDIALLRLSKSAVVNENDVKPACLDTDVDVDYTGRDAVATGWGATGFGEEGSESLLKVNLTMRELQYCKDNLDLDTNQVPRGLVDEHLCAGGGSHGRDTCQGDSGGPLQVRADPTNHETCMFRLLGIVSFGPPCGLGKPAVYTKVAAYVEWIETIVWPPRSDGCSRETSSTGGEILVPYTGPGTVARGMCRVYHVDYCVNYDPHMISVKPDLTLHTACHHNQPEISRWERRRPTTATFRYGSGSYNTQFACAGALISPNTVITAARCRSLGCLPLSNVVLDSPLRCDGKNIFGVESVVVHPDYLVGEAYADLAVVKLTQSVDLRHFLPSCLHTLADGVVQPGVRATAAGWNIQGSWERTSYDLPNTTLTIREAEECSSSLLRSEKYRKALPKGLLPSQLCAGGLCDQESYAGEPGVPLALQQYTLSTRHGDYFVDRVVGVSSSLSFCTEKGTGDFPLPDLFSRVANHIEWIEGVVWPEEARNG